jgi:hypothetical protein
MESIDLSPFVPAKAGTQEQEARKLEFVTLGPRFRGDERDRASDQLK